MAFEYGLLSYTASVRGGHKLLLQLPGQEDQVWEKIRSSSELKAQVMEVLNQVGGEGWDLASAFNTGYEMQYDYWLRREKVAS